MGASNIIFTNTPLGLMWLWATDVGLCNVGFGDSIDPGEIRRMAKRGIETPLPVMTSLLESATAQLYAYYARRRRRFDVPLDLRGTEFQQQVWLLLQETPYGETTTYGEIAMLLGRPKATRAVGQAVGANPVSIIVPCHRVIGSNGKLTGYGGGLERKATLLELEQAGLQLRMELAMDAPLA
jgi:O-6-methylguanine DNA methyltransferase